MADAAFIGAESTAPPAADGANAACKGIKLTLRWLPRLDGGKSQVSSCIDTDVRSNLRPLLSVRWCLTCVCIVLRFADLARL